MMTRSWLLAFLLVMSACGGDATTTAAAPTPTSDAAVATATATPVPAPTQLPEPTPSPEPTPAPEPTDVPFTAADLLPSEDQWVRYPHDLQDERFFVEDIVVTPQVDAPPIVLVSSFRHVHIFQPSSAEVVTTEPGAPFGEFAFVTSLVDLQGEYFVAIGEDPQAGELLPNIRRWDAGEAEWRTVETTVTQASSHFSATRTAGAALAATPPSPPFPGASAIMDMTVHNEMIWATGWATVDGAVRAVIWQSLDGTDWKLTVLPTVRDAFGPEYGQAIGVSDLGVVVGLGNGTHFGAGVLGRPHGGSWATLPFPTTDDATSVTRTIDSSDDRLWVHEVRFEGPDSIFVTTDLDTWAEMVLPEPAEVSNGDALWRVAANRAAGPVAWLTDASGATDPATAAYAWHEDLGDFVAVEMPGIRYLGSTEGYWVLEDADALIVVPID